MDLDTVHQIERAIDALTPAQREELYLWLDEHYLQPSEIQLRAAIDAGRFEFKKLTERGGQELWSVRVTLKYRALAVKIHDDYVWFWIDELARTREMLDSRYDDMKSGRVQPVDGESFLKTFDAVRTNCSRSIRRSDRGAGLPASSACGAGHH